MVRSWSESPLGAPIRMTSSPIRKIRLPLPGEVATVQGVALDIATAVNELIDRENERERLTHFFRQLDRAGMLPEGTP